MVPSGVLDVKRIELEASAAPCSSSYDVRLDEYALWPKRALPIRLLQPKAPRCTSAYTTRSPTTTTSARAPSRAS